MILTHKTFFQFRISLSRCDETKVHTYRKSQKHTHTDAFIYSCFDDTTAKKKKKRDFITRSTTTTTTTRAACTY